MVVVHATDYYFDFISPYVWLAFEELEEFSREYGVDFQLRPVLYGALLNATGLVGPVEVESKRRYTFVDAVRTARAKGRELVGPPAHPFRSLDALRLVTAELGTERALPLARALARACWAEGRDLADVATLAEVAESVAVSTAGLRERLGAPEVKAALRQSTEEALACGVFGVPTFGYRGELFWGHDRMAQLGAAIRAGRAPILASDLGQILSRPKGVDRRK